MTNVFLPPWFQPRGHVQHGVVEDLAFDQLQGYDEPPYSAIAVRERVQGFELIVAQGDTDQEWNSIGQIDPLLPVGESLFEDFSWWRRDEACLRDWATVIADKDLSFAQLA